MKNLAPIAAVLVHLLALAMPAAAQNVTTYHNSIDRTGAYVLSGLTLANAAKMHLDAAFNAPVTGNVYAQPLYWQPKDKPGEVIVATESDIVYALNASTGATIWQTTLGSPVPKSDLPCTNINPEGVTGTPAIDPSSGTIYLDALVETANGPHQQVFALDPGTGAILPNWPIDIQSAAASGGNTFDSYTQGERSAVLLLGGQLYISYAGRSGDCGTYHGTVVQIAPATQTIAGFWATRARGGGIWAQGGAFSDGASIFVTTGNTMDASAWGDGEAIIRLAPGLTHSTDTKNYFTPANWLDLDKEDADLGGTDAIALQVPLAGGGTAERLLALGKDHYAYLVNADNLGGIGSQLAKVQVSHSGIITATAVYATPSARFVAFRNSSDLKCVGSAITMLNVTANSLQENWCAPMNGGGAPIVTTTDGVNNAIVWAVGAGGDQLLHGFSAATGAVVFDGGGSANAMTGTLNFATILAAEGKFYVAAQGRIYSFTYF